MGIQQRMASSGDIAKSVGITIHKRVESPAPVSSMKSGTVVSRAPRKKTKKIYPINPIVGAIATVFPPAAFLPGGPAAGATEIAVKHPEIIVGSVFPPVAIMGGPTGTPGYVAKKATDELIVEQVKRDPDIPQEFKNALERSYLDTYEKFEKDVYTAPDIKITMPEIKLPEMPSLLPDLSGLGKWLLIGGAILAAILILPALISRKAAKTVM